MRGHTQSPFAGKHKIPGKRTQIHSNVNKDLVPPSGLGKVILLWTKGWLSLLVGLFSSRNEILKSQGCDRLQSNTASMSRQTGLGAVSSLWLQYPDSRSLCASYSSHPRPRSSHPSYNHILYVSTGAHRAPEAPPNDASAPFSSIAIHIPPPNTALSGDGHFWRVTKPTRISAGVTHVPQASVSLLLSWAWTIASDRHLTSGELWLGVVISSLHGSFFPHVNQG